MRQLSGSAREAAFGMLTPAEEFDDVLQSLFGREILQQGEGVDDPVAEPRTTRVQAFVRFREAFQT